MSVARKEMERKRALRDRVALICNALDRAEPSRLLTRWRREGPAVEAVEAMRRAEAGHDLREALARVEAARQQAEKEMERARRFAEGWRDTACLMTGTKPKPDERFPWEAS